MVSTKKAAEFTNIIGKLNFPAPTTDKGRGFLPPFIRGLGHLIYAMACIADGKEQKEKEFVEKYKESVKSELKASYEHILTMTVSKTLSDEAQTNLKTFGEAFKAATEEFDAWDDDTKLSNFRTLVNKGVAIAAAMDRELIGIRDSDPGSNL